MESKAFKQVLGLIDALDTDVGLPLKAVDLILGLMQETPAWNFVYENIIPEMLIELEEDGTSFFLSPNSADALREMTDDCIKHALMKEEE